MKLLLLLFALIGITYAGSPCEGRDYQRGSIACVATEQHNDEYDTVQKSPKGVVQVFTTTKSGKRLAKTEKFTLLPL
ncbi:unnamed protein product [Medioppia subpectinata]|uniref:Uncharacterized protein n=1 Tax=Medioppia subpectinata TaxID=1979941 RepID=A0A7R9KBP2_9ACAR|nr:unnamed protein product [Medioppia subpectinata]CAG2100446.1 unnamed protein product [Medioppia subpectinata]